MLQLDDVHTYYGNIQALKGISLEIKKGEIVSLIGANGAGKSTTLMTISGIIKPKKGKIIFEDKEIQNERPDSIVARGICQVPEGRRIFPRLTVVENLEMGAFLKKEKKEVRKNLENIFELFPVLKERRGQIGGTLSGGEQQMLSIARALMAKPKLLLMDEPSLGLAPLFVQHIFEIIREINKNGTTIFLVEQNAHMALTVSHRGYVLETGRIILHDISSDLLKNDLVRKSYLGES